MAVATASVRDNLRVIRVNAQGLQESLAKLDASDEAFTNVKESEQRLWEINATQIDDGLATVKGQIAAREPGAEIADEVEKIDNAWDRAKEDWLSFIRNVTAVPMVDQVARKALLDQTNTDIGPIIRSVGVLTIPERVRVFMSQELPGGVVDFHEAFKDELPLEADRTFLLNYLVGAPGRIYGLVDPASGNIWAISPEAGRRLRSYRWAAAILLIGGLMTWFLPDIASGLGISTSSLDRGNLLATYALVALGVIVHVGVDLYKDSKKKQGRRWTAVDELILWGHAHELEVYLTVLGVWAGVLGLVFLFGRVEPLTAFLAGYSLDSFLDAGMARLEPIVTKGTKDLTARISATQGGAA